MKTLRIRSGGQSGVDRAALDFAVERGLAYQGWCPAGGWAEDLTTPPGLLARYPHLVATPSDDPRQRTAWNIRDSDVTVLVTPDGTCGSSDGSQYTADCAELVFLRPFCVVDLSDPEAAEALAAFLADALHSRGGAVLDLNVAGPRESDVPGIYERTRTLLEAAWHRLRSATPAS